MKTIRSPFVRTRATQKPTGRSQEAKRRRLIARLHKRLIQTLTKGVAHENENQNEAAG
jgi:hypothetical protein